MANIDIERTVDDVADSQEARDGSMFRPVKGSSVPLWGHDTPRIPASHVFGDGVHEMVWGCDSQRSQPEEVL